MKPLYFNLILILILIAIFDTIYKKYNKECIEYYAKAEHYSNLEQDEKAYIKTAGLNKSYAIKKLCLLQTLVEKSISISQIDNTDINYSFDKSEEIELGGSYETNRIESEISKLEKNGEIVYYSKWNPDLVESKDGIIIYVHKLIQKYNSKILELNGMKIKISDFITYFRRLLSEGIDSRLLGQCLTCRRPECEKVLCAHQDESEFDRAKKNKELIMKDEKTLENMVVEFILLYKLIEDIRNAIVKYINKMNDIWSNAELKDVQIKLNYSVSSSEIVDK